MALATRSFETSPPAGPESSARDEALMLINGALTERYGRMSTSISPIDASVEVGPTSFVLLLLVAADQVDNASQFSAELCVEAEENFGGRCSVIVLPKDD